MKPEGKMNASQAKEREAAKSPHGLFLNELEEGYGLKPRIAESIVVMAERIYQAPGAGLRPGQQWVVLVKRRSRHGQPLSASQRVQVIWTVDNGEEDRQVRAASGSEGLRQVRIQRLLDEALEQDAVATQEDLAQALQVSKRTIQRDMAVMSQAGQLVPTRGYLQGIGRGQTHKGKIIRLWLQGQTYDQLVLSTHHCAASIERYIRSFVQVVRLQRTGCTAWEIQTLLGMGRPLVEEYLHIAAENDQGAAHQRLEAELARTKGRVSVKKGAQ